MKKIFLSLVFLSSVLTYGNTTPFWGKTGHRATGQIASTYLTKKAKQKIAKILDGKSLALVSTYGDDIKSDDHYDKYKPWHYINIPKGETYEAVKDEPGPTIISAIAKCKAALENDKTPLVKKKFYLKMLIHLVGDLHQPLHVGRPDDRGGNDIIVFWFGEVSNLHRVWDSDMINSFLMSYSELAANQQKLSAKEVKEIQQGGPVDWLKDTRKITKKIYQSAKNGYHLGYDYMYKWMPVVRQQLQKGGIRLAKMLNEIFG